MKKKKGKKQNINLLMSPTYLSCYYNKILAIYDTTKIKIKTVM